MALIIIHRIFFLKMFTDVKKFLGILFVKNQKLKISNLL